MSEKEKNRDIELRSEKVRNIIGQIPSRILRIGITVISVIILLVILLFYFIPYPEYKQFPIHLFATPSVQAVEAPQAGILLSVIPENVVEKGQKICSFKLENDSVIEYCSDNAGVLFCNYKETDKIKQGDVIFYIIPDSITSIYGICFIPVDEIKNIKEKQQVVIISAQQHFFDGSISKIYPIPEIDHSVGMSFYKVEIALNDYTGNRCKACLLPNMENKCKILISNEHILRKITK